MDNEFSYSTRVTSQSPAEIKKSINKKVGCGCSVIPLLLLFILGYFLAYHLLFPSLFPAWIRGEFQNLVVFPSKEGKDKLWIQTDGSFSYIQETKSAGSHSIGRKGFFEKTYSYVYDPVSETVIKGYYTKLDYLPAAPEMFYMNGKVWVITPSINAPPFVNAYNPDTYDEVINTQSFCAKNPQLSAGLEKLYIDKSLPVRMTLTAKDGKEVIYSLQDEMFFEDYAAMTKYYKEHEKNVNIFTLEAEKNSTSRKVLYYINGPASQLYFSSPRGQYIAEYKGSNNYKDMTAVLMAPGKAFLESELLYFDNEIAVVIHQDNVGKTANRMLTCVDKTGKELWIIPQEELFDEIKVEESDAFSVIFFMKSRMSVQRSGSIVVFSFKPEGAMAFELNSGKKLWEFTE
jgi:outer membrane protein assembly factor BamB